MLLKLVLMAHMLVIISQLLVEGRLLSLQQSNHRVVTHFAK
jgi:hypothetical protein